MKLTGSGVVFEGREAHNRSALYPGVCVMPSGRWIATFRAAPERESTTRQRVLMCVSDDNGASWSARDCLTPPEVEGRAGEFFNMYITPLGGDEALGSIIWVDVSDPSRPYHNPETQGIIDHRVFFTRTSDGGESWSQPYIMEGVPHPRPKALTAPTLLLPGGRLCCQFEVHKHHDDAGPAFFEGAVVFSDDGGRSWKDYTVVSRDPESKLYYWDQRISAVDDELLGLFWTYSDEQSRYLNIHAARSAPGGMSWGAHYDTGVPGQPSQPILLVGGGMAMAYVDRTDSPAIRVRLSADGGRTWPTESEVTLFDSAQARQDNAKTSLNDMWGEMYNFSTGFPSAAALPDGGLLVCWYAGPDTNNTSIMWARLSPDG